MLEFRQGIFYWFIMSKITVLAKLTSLLLKKITFTVPLATALQILVMLTVIE